MKQIDSLQPQQLIERAVSDDHALKQYIGKAYPGDCTIGDFAFYKNYLAQFKSPPFEILINEQEEFDNMLIIKLIAASFETGYIFINSNEYDSLHMKIFLNDDDQDEMITLFLDELEGFQLENMVLNFIDEQIKIEEAASKCPYSSLILSLQRNYKVKKWNIITAMAQSKSIAFQLINKENR